MSFTVCMDDQRSPAWFTARLGRLTGSRAADMLSVIKSGEAAARRDLRTQLVCERLTNTLQEDPFVNVVMQRGIDLEPAAFSAYEGLTGSVAYRSGFLSHDTLMVGCSLDGHIQGGSGPFWGILECKCPKSATHLRYLRSGIAPSDYLSQITHNLWVSEAAWCDFLSFDDRFPPPLQTFLVRVSRADVDLIEYEKKALAFLAEVDREVEAVATMANVGAVLKEAIHAEL